MSNRLLLLTALLAAPACTVPYPYSPYGPYAQDGAHGYGPNAATTVTEDGTVVVVVIDPAALQELTEDARRTGRTVVQVNLGREGVRQGSDLALSAEHNDQVLADLAAAETGHEPARVASEPHAVGNRTSTGSTGWTRGTGNVSTVSNATPDKTERTAVEQPVTVAQADPEPVVETTPEPVVEPVAVATPEPAVEPVAEPASPAVTVSEPVREKPQPVAAAPTRPATPRGPVVTPGARPRTEEPSRPTEPQRTYRPVAGSSWWAPIGLVKKARGDQ